MPTRADRPLLPLAVIPLAALIAILPMLVRGPSCGHDFTFHLTSWLEAASQFRHGVYPHWAYTPAFNAGEPRFIFYPPLSWSLGALLGLILPWSAVPTAFVWIALTLSGLTSYRLARRYAGTPAAMLAATLYLGNPYMLFTAYERSAFAELLAAALLPLLLQAALAARVRILSIASAVALLWLTNAPAAVMSCYALAVLTAIRLCLPCSSIQQESSSRPKHRSLTVMRSGETPVFRLVFLLTANPRLHLALTTTAGTLLGLTLAAFYILPAAAERHLVRINMATVEGMRISDHFLFHRMSAHTPDALFHDAVVRTASVIVLSMLALTGLACWAAFARQRRIALPLALLTLTLAFLLTPLSGPIWDHLPELRFLQFPWRLTALLAAILSLVTALALPPLRTLPGGVAALALAAMLSLPAWLFFHQPCDEEDSIPARVALYHGNEGSEPTDEYTPVQADNDALKHDPPYWLTSPSADEAARNVAAPPAAEPGPAPDHLTLTLPAPEALILNRRVYPAWQIRVNGTQAAPRTPERDDGLITLALPAGTSTVDLTLSQTSDETAGLALSALAGFAALTLGRRGAP